MMNEKSRKTISSARRGILLLALAGGLFGAAATAQAIDLRINANEDKLLTLAGAPATVIVGNPLFADVTVLGRKILVQGRMPGATSITVLDTEGQQLAKLDVTVISSTKNTLRVYKGGDYRLTYACQPTCERMLTIGDATKATSELTGQIATYNAAIKQSMDMSR